MISNKDSSITNWKFPSIDLSLSFIFADLDNAGDRIAKFADAERWSEFK